MMRCSWPVVAKTRDGTEVDAPRLVLLTHLGAADIQALEPVLGRPVVVHTQDDLDRASQEGGVLLSFGTGTIVPPTVLQRFAGRAYNLHAASPDYPGRDPHHFAAYDAAPRYGATLHLMTDKVDAGPIVDVEMFDTPPEASPAALLQMANDAALRILRRVGPRLRRGEGLPPLEGVTWGPVKRSRADFLAMCRITPDMPAQEFARRYRAFDGGDHDNLYIEVHGRRFRIDKRP
jgi:methionyl-tRNA formyltransferase